MKLRVRVICTSCCLATTLLFSQSNSRKAVSQVVNKATTTTTLTSSRNPSHVGQSVNFTANEAPEFGSKVTGSVAFYDGATLLKTVDVNGGVAKYTTSTLTQGMHSITATYNGSTSFDGSSAFADTDSRLIARVRHFSQRSGPPNRCVHLTQLPTNPRNPNAFCWVLSVDGTACMARAPPLTNADTTEKWPRTKVQTVLLATGRCLTQISSSRRCTQVLQ